MNHVAFCILPVVVIEPKDMSAKYGIAVSSDMKSSRGKL